MKQSALPVSVPVALCGFSRIALFEAEARAGHLHYRRAASSAPLFRLMPAIDGSKVK